ncbi:MAG: ABC transporter ATP-binding protein [Alphaproteobacteria bacterium]|uniref:ABC transporter ATP-binding protein n=1 Tax=Candidatus Nitrobium versatile TaxID=2884831 RepID=A0A953J4S9_9BACT|nr:ABC transporter ATP-binding protein [Candidatus Nitrobium versatile]
MNKGILFFHHVSFSYAPPGGFIEDLNLSVDEGRFICLLGANGSGKSTILKLGSGIYTPSKGTVTLWNKPLREYKGKDKAKLLSYLPQVLDLGVPFRVRELVEMGRYPYGDVPPAVCVSDALRMVGLENKENSFVNTLSGGERRRAFIAMTLLQGAGVLLLDEPLANLDIKYQLELIRILKSIRNVTVMMALHDINMAFEFDTVILVKKGRILGMGSPHEMLTEEMLEEAFEVNLAIKRIGQQAFISYKE